MLESAARARNRVANDAKRDTDLATKLEARKPELKNSSKVVAIKLKKIEGFYHVA